jgi:hypothetical protein
LIFANAPRACIEHKGHRGPDQECGWCELDVEAIVLAIRATQRRGLRWVISGSSAARPTAC